MCGIVGLAGTINVKEERLFRELLVVDTLRGNDSTGVAAVGKYGEVIVSKQAGDPFQLFETHHFREIMKRKNKVFIGHNRAATTGKVNRANAHPFEFETLVGVHNGTLRNKHMLDNGYKFDTDSEALYSHIEKKGLQDAIDTANGAYSLVWWDKEESTLNFLRNSERPMKLLFSEDRRTLFFASESWMLTCLLGREGYKHGQIEDLPVDQHFSFQIPEEGKEFEKAKVRQVKPAPFQQTTSTTTKTSSAVTGGGSTDNLPAVHPKAEELMALFKKREIATSSRSLIIGSKVEGYSKSWGQDEHGSYYVSFLVVGHIEEEFRCYVRNKEDAQRMLCRMYSGTISKMRYDKRWIYNLQPDTLIPRFKREDDKPVKGPESLPLITAQVIDFVIEDKKKDHQGELITKAEFDSRYSNCSWCSDPLLFEEEWKAFSRTDALCPHCVNNPEVNKYLNPKKEAC
jgi:predicted glutamine amidotransferase